MTPLTENLLLDSPKHEFNSGVQPVSGVTANPDDVERVKSQWGEDLNTAFAYDKYIDRGLSGAWAASALRYEWSEETDVDAIAPRDEALEKILFGDDGEGNMGINFDKYHLLHGLMRYDQINVTYKSTEKVIPIMKVVIYVISSDGSLKRRNCTLLCLRMYLWQNTLFRRLFR
jgi:hypothetical protein